MYSCIRNFLFLLPPEIAHSFSLKILAWAPNWLFPKPFNNSIECMGIKFPHRVGLAAGFDKNGEYLDTLSKFGFAFIEVGTVTPRPQSGNKKPRLFNRMGFNNDGVDVIVSRLTEWRKANPNSTMIIGGNIGKNKQTPNENAFRDYEICFEKLFHLVDYFVVNVSSPNTPGLRELQEKESLHKILTYLQMLNRRRDKPKPLLLKIAPDLTEGQLQDIADLAMEIKLDGLVVSNTTISREGLITNKDLVNKIGAGGLSGKPVQEISNRILRSIREKTNETIPLIGSGGIFTGDDALEKIRAGANLVQVWTGFVYEGPAIVKKIVRSLNRG